MLWQENGYFDNSSEYKPLLHLWSLGIEEQFYIFWPFACWLSWKLKGSFSKITLFFLLVSFSANILYLSFDAVGTFYGPATGFWELLVGSMIAIPTYSDLLKRLTSFQQNLASCLGILLLSVALFVINERSQFPGWPVYSGPRCLDSSAPVVS